MLVDVLAVCDAALHSAWLLPLLLGLVAIDGPFPVLPSETLLMTAAAMAFGEHRALMVLGLFLVATAGSVLGDLLLFWFGRSSHRVLASTIDRNCGLSSWVRRHLLLRPGIVLVGARFVPGGRLVSTAAAGRYGLPLHRFVPWSVASSVAWSGYMLLVGMLLGPLTGGNPLLSLAAGVAMAIVTGAAFAVVQRVRARRSIAALPVSVPVPEAVA